MFSPDPVRMFQRFFPETDKIYLDIETSGLEPDEGAVILSMGFIYITWIDDEDNKPKRLEINITPTQEEWEAASPDALKLNGMTWEFLEANGMPRQDAINRLCRWFYDINRRRPVYAVGQNPDFDFKFFKYFFGNELSFVGFPMDPKKRINNIEIAKELIKIDPTFKPTKYNSHALSKALGVEEESATHTAMGGTKAVFRNYGALLARTEHWVSQLRQEVLAKNYERAIGTLGKAKTLEEFAIEATKVGWTCMGKDRTPHIWVDKDGQRWSFVTGVPPILVKL